MTKPVNAQAMLEAAASGELGLLTRELERGVSVFSKDLTGNNALIVSLQNGNEDIALILIGRMAEAAPSFEWVGEASRSSGFNVLHVAVENRRLRALSALLSMLPDPMAFVGKQSAKGLEETPIHLAAREDSTKALSLLLKACPKALELVKSHDEQTPLATAIAADKVDAVGFLLKAKADLVGFSPTRNPAWSFVQSVGMSNLLSDHLSWESVRDHTGSTVLHVFASRGKSLRLQLLKSMLSRPKCVELLMVADDFGRTPLYRALAANAAVDVIDLMVAKGSRWHLADQEGLSPADILEQQLAYGWQIDEGVVGAWRSQARQQRLDEVCEPATFERTTSRL